MSSAAASAIVVARMRTASSVLRLAHANAPAASVRFSLRRRHPVFSSSAVRSLSSARPEMAANAEAVTDVHIGVDVDNVVDVRGRTGTLNDGILQTPLRHHHHQHHPTHQDPSSATSSSQDSTGGAVMGQQGPMFSLLFELSDGSGALMDALKYFWKHDVSLARIESRPHKITYGEDGSIVKRTFDFSVDCLGSIGDNNVDRLLECLEDGVAERILILDEKEVQWFPRHISELDLVANRTLDAGTDLESDHPGFNDSVYRVRRAELARLAQEHRHDKSIERIEYTPEEIETWTAVWDRMEGLWEKYACREYKHSLEQMKAHCGYGRDTIPQQADISDYLVRRTNFRMRPVAGLLSSRDFLNGLAFRVFFSTQYIRHHSKPLYTPEPDICHELLGHAPMFADRDFADFSQEIGLASLGASDDDIEKLARCYWHSVEFGLCREDGHNKAYGAGLLSSFGELEWACGDGEGGDDLPRRPEIRPWDPSDAAVQDFPITTYQPVYFLAESLQDAKDRMRRYCEDLPRPFFALYNSHNSTVHIDRPIRRSVLEMSRT